MKEKPICVEQGQKLAKEVTEPLQNVKISVKAAWVIIETNIYCIPGCISAATCIISFNPCTFLGGSVTNGGVGDVR